MAILQVSLFGKFEARLDGTVLTCFETGKVRELFCYLLLHRNRPHPREVLAGLLWGESSIEQSRCYLRKTLWQFHAALNAQAGSGSNLMLVVDPGWVEFDMGPGLWMDVAELERAYNCVRGSAGAELSIAQIQSLKAAVELYRGNLLEGWYQNWCLSERERLLHLYLTMLDKLMGNSEAQRDCEAGVFYGDLILHYDSARERTHRRLMRLYWLTGDRTAALRQYERCVTSLREELGVRPSKRTVELFEHIRADQLQTAGTLQAAEHSEVGLVPELLSCLNQLQVLLARVQDQIQKADATMDGLG
jgi:DNA-binding SARP family transcriptional activator